MKYSHWEFLLLIYQNQKRGLKVLEMQCNKNLIKTCHKKGWIEIFSDGAIIITTVGIEASKEIAPLYEFDNRQIGQTF